MIDADELTTAFPCGETVRTECVRATIEHMPTIEERKKGEWKEDEYGIRHCCYCNCVNNTLYTNFCQNCGADMREE